MRALIGPSWARPGGTGRAAHSPVHLVPADPHVRLAQVEGGWQGASLENLAADPFHAQLGDRQRGRPHVTRTGDLAAGRLEDLPVADRPVPDCKDVGNLVCGVLRGRNRGSTELLEALAVTFEKRPVDLAAPCVNDRSQPALPAPVRVSQSFKARDPHRRDTTRGRDCGRGCQAHAQAREQARANVDGHPVQVGHRNTGLTAQLVDGGHEDLDVALARDEQVRSNGPVVIP